MPDAPAKTETEANGANGANGAAVAASAPVQAPSNEANGAEAIRSRATNTGGEVTQTDRLNRRLLESLRERMNQGDAALDRMMSSNDDQDNDDEWGDANK